MADLKQDLVNKINNDKYFAEVELVRLASEPNTNYKCKIDDMSKLLDEIALANIKIQLIENVYFKQQTTQTINSMPQQGGVIHNGQTHGE